MDTRKVPLRLQFLIYPSKMQLFIFIKSDLYEEMLKRNLMFTHKYILFMILGCFFCIIFGLKVSF